MSANLLFLKSGYVPYSHFEKKADDNEILVVVIVKGSLEGSEKVKVLNIQYIVICRTWNEYKHIIKVPSHFMYLLST